MGAGPGIIYSIPWGREHRGPREGLLKKREEGARKDVVHLTVVLRPGPRQPALAVPSPQRPCQPGTAQLAA